MKRAAALCALVAILIIPRPSPAGEVVLHNFACPPRGANPYAGVTADAAGNLYGTTAAGGTALQGPVWLNIHNDGSDFTFKYSFDGVKYIAESSNSIGVTAFTSTVPASRVQPFRKAKAKSAGGMVCPICTVDPENPVTGHDGRAHKSQGKRKRPFTAAELKARG